MENNNNNNGNNENNEEIIQFFGTSEFNAVLYNENKEKFYGLASIRCKEEDIDLENEEDDIDNETRAPMYLIAVVDKSGSMSGEKIKCLRETLKFTASQMTSKDYLCIVEFDTHAYLSMKFTCMDDFGQQKALKTINKIQPGSSTNISGAILLGLEQIPSDLPDNVVLSSLVLTDGKANAGIRTSNGIIQMFEKYFTDNPEKHLSTLNTFGYGKQHNADFLKDIAVRGEGSYYFIENNDDIGDIFADVLGGLQTVNAQGIEVTIKAKDGVEINKIYSGSKKVTTIEEKTHYRISVGDIQSGEHRDYPIEFSLPSLDQPLENEITVADLTISFLNVKNDSYQTIESTISVKRPDQDSILENDQVQNDLIKRQVLRVLSAEAMDTSDQLANNGQLQEARDHLDNLIQQFDDEMINQNDTMRVLKEDLEFTKKAMKSKNTYNSNKNILKDNVVMYSKQRAGGYNAKKVLHQEHLKLKLVRK